jgi:hypothetical protein
MHYVSWSGWATLFFQVMPVFFVVGGYLNATSWTAHYEAAQLISTCGLSAVATRLHLSLR